MMFSNLLRTPIARIKSNAPEILIVTGVGCVVYGTIKACQATRKLDAILDEHKTDVREIKDEGMFPDDERREITKRYAKTAWEMFRLYAPSVAIGGAGVALIFKGHGILRQRYIALAAAYRVLDKSYEMYRKRVIGELGEAMDKHFRFGMTEEEVEATETGKNGKEKTVKKKVNVVDPEFEKYSPYARCFDEFSKEWRDDPALNKAYIIQIQNYANDYLRTHGKLFLNHVYKWLGFKETKAGQVAGWIYDPNQKDGDNKVDFGLTEVYKRAAEGDVCARMWVNNIEPSIMLDFNCKGNILDEAFDEYI